jgi:hypothetical protein
MVRSKEVMARPCGYRFGPRCTTIRSHARRQQRQAAEAVAAAAAAAAAVNKGGAGCLAAGSCGVQQTQQQRQCTCADCGSASARHFCNSPQRSTCHAHVGALHPTPPTLSDSSADA